MDSICPCVGTVSTKYKKHIDSSGLHKPVVFKVTYDYFNITMQDKIIAMQIAYLYTIYNLTSFSSSARDT